jgi:hypothetical protein
MLLPMTSSDAPMSAAIPIQRVAIPTVARTRKSALVTREKATLNRMILNVRRYRKTDGKTWNLAARARICRRFNCRFPERISETTPWLPISARSA